MSNDVFEPVESDEEQDYDLVPGDTSFLLKVSDSSGVVNLSYMLKKDKVLPYKTKIKGIDIHFSNIIVIMYLKRTFRTVLKKFGTLDGWL